MRIKLGVDATEYALFGSLEKLETLRIYVQPQVSSLVQLFKSLATKKTKGLLSIHDAKMNYDEVDELAKVLTLRTLHCQLIEPQHLELLTSIAEMDHSEVTFHNVLNESRPADVDLIKFTLFVEKKSKTLVLFVENHTCSTLPYEFISKLHNVRLIRIEGSQGSGSL
ncbi:uncharacterized protein LOC117893907 [Drosophila subobscura]|uniref:uncharacterized protein LOC117893907 n=1 Tax=Drosophila subobscura TaxID=7241 RepID=UPI00155A5DAC|nr:uncharacterized protein LOC117893907 [Drosophila subobscura]